MAVEWLNLILARLETVERRVSHLESSGLLNLAVDLRIANATLEQRVATLERTIVRLEEKERNTSQPAFQFRPNHDCPHCQTEQRPSGFRFPPSQPVSPFGRPQQGGYSPFYTPPQDFAPPAPNTGNDPRPFASCQADSSSTVPFVSLPAAYFQGPSQSSVVRQTFTVDSTVASNQ